MNSQHKQQLYVLTAFAFVDAHKTFTIQFVAFLSTSSVLTSVSTAFHLFLLSNNQFDVLLIAYVIFEWSFLMNTANATVKKNVFFFRSKIDWSKLILTVELLILIKSALF